MRRWSAILMAGVMAACSSNPVTTGNPQPGVPATITAVTGDGQIAAPGAALPVKLSVLVKDGTGAAVSGVTVNFAIESGGGLLSASSATTGSDGIAGNITWTLGTSGANVVTATVASLPSLRMHAQATGDSARPLVNNATIAASGGTVVYHKPGDPLDGLAVTVPASAYPSATTWSVVADPGIAVSLPAGFALAGPPLVIGNGQGLADSVMTLTMPMRLGSDVAAAPFYYDPASKLLEPIALVDRTDTSATLATRHFSVDLLALPDANGASALRASLRQGFGNVVIVWVQTPLSQLTGTWTSGFQPGTDDWEFANYGDYISPNGDCEGMSITAMYYWYTFRRGAGASPGLFHRYDKSVANQWDNVQGIRLAGSVQGDYSLLWSLGVNQVAALNAAAVAHGANLQLLTSSWIALTIKLTHQPVLLALRGSGGGHAVVAYAAAVSGLGFTTVSIANPNDPGTSQSLNFTNGAFQAMQFQPTKDGTAAQFDNVYALGVSSEVPIPAIALRWIQFENKAAGVERYPTGYTLELHNPYTSDWKTVTGHDLVVYDSVLLFQTRCTACAGADPAPPSQPARAWDAAGDAPLSDDDQVEFDSPGSSSTWVVMYGLNGSSARAGFLESDSLRITWQKVTIDGPARSPAGDTVTYNVGNPPHEPRAHYTYTWNFGDNTSSVTEADKPSIKHAFAANGRYDVNLQIMNTDTHELLFTKTVQQTINDDIIFEITQATQTATTLPPGGIGSEKGDTASQKLINTLMSQITAGPPNGNLIYLAGGPARCHAVIFEAFGTAPTVFDSLVPFKVAGVWGSNCDLQPNWVTTLTLGPLGNGTIVGTAVDSPQLPADEENEEHGGSINATMNGNVLTGSVVWNVKYSTGIAQYTFTFRAIQDVP